jgi:hypothetical protein
MWLTLYACNSSSQVVLPQDALLNLAKKKDFDEAYTQAWSEHDFGHQDT